METKTGSWLLVGASRGLGASFARLLLEGQPRAEITVVSRKPPSLSLGRWISADISKTEGQQTVLELCHQSDFTHAIYFAGGGPFADFQKREWKDHHWALQVTFLFAAQWTHFLLSKKNPPKSLTLIGSSVAETGGDPGAASYAAAKAGLRGLFESLALEKPSTELRMFSPGYMDTDLLPKGSFPREQQVWSPEVVAAELYEFLLSGEPFTRRQLTPYPR